MTSTTWSGLRTLAFGDLDAGVWGAIWDMTAQGKGFVCLGTLGPDPAQTIPSAAIEGSDPAADWRLTGNGVELVLAPEGEAAWVSAADGGPEGFDQLCRVRGLFACGGAEHTVDCLGKRSGRNAVVDFNRFESVRDVSAWFEPAEGIVLLALRPRAAVGHDGDVLGAALFEAGHSIPVADPRLSTTYAPTGLPARVSAELWLGGDDEEAQEYPRRAAGESVGVVARSADTCLDVSAEPFRWHARGREGAGVYLLVRPR